MREVAAAGRSVLRESGVDALALKPTAVDVAALASGDLDGVPVDALPDTVAIDFEGRDAMPDREVLEGLADAIETLRVTTPVRADGFDPLGDDSDLSSLPEAAGHVLVAGHPAYLDERERQRAIAPRLREAVDAADGDDAAGTEPWVGTEGIERLALAVGATQFELLGPTVERDVRSLRAAGFDGAVAVYAPTVLTDDDDAILDAVGDYVARRGAVASALADAATADAATADATTADAEVTTDADATGEVRRVLSTAARDYALVGDVASVRERTDALRDAGVDHVVAYPAAGLASLLG